VANIIQGQVTSIVLLHHSTRFQLHQFAPLLPSRAAADIIHPVTHLRVSSADASKGGNTPSFALLWWHALRHYSTISATYLRHIFDITAPYLRHYSNISSTLHRHYSNISATLQHHIFDITATLQQHICDITAPYLRHYSDITATYLRHYIDITATYLRHYSTISSTLHNAPRRCCSSLPIHNILFSDILGQDIFGVFPLDVVGYRWHV